jgi:hypothetical protein
MKKSLLSIGLLLISAPFWLVMGKVFLYVYPTASGMADVIIFLMGYLGTILISISITKD